MAKEKKPYLEFDTKNFHISFNKDCTSVTSRNNKSFGCFAFEGKLAKELANAIREVENVR